MAGLTASHEDYPPRNIGCYSLTSSAAYDVNESAMLRRGERGDLLRAGILAIILVGSLF